LKILSKVTGPTTGSIKANGRIASLLEVGTGFHPEMTGKENIFLNGAILGMTKKEIACKLDEIIQFSGCERYVDTPVKRYSSGMKVRLAFAVAAFLEPDILIVDEVLAVGDAEFQKKAIGKMQDISSQAGRTVLFVSHDMVAIQSLCSRLIVLKNGSISFNGNVNEGINFYLSKTKVKTENLLDLKNRKGTGRSLFSDISFSYKLDDELINNVDEIPSGVELIIDLGIYSYKSTEKNVQIAIRISDTNGNFLIKLGNEFTLDKLHLEQGKNKVRFEIPSINLVKGTYFLTLWGADSIGMFDRLEDEVSFKIIESDFFGTGKYPKKKTDGIFMLMSKQFNI